MDIMSWKYDSHVPVYRMQFDDVKLEDRKSVLRSMTDDGWSFSGEGFGIIFSLFFTKEFKSANDFFKWAENKKDYTIFFEKNSGEIIQLNNKKKGRPRLDAQRFN
jgi:hypothetical protein